MTTSYSLSGAFSSPTTQCWTFTFVAGQVKSKEGISNLIIADRWRHLAELHAAPRWLWRAKRGSRSENQISSVGQQPRQMLLTTRLSFAFSSSRSDKDLACVTSINCGCRWPTGADHGKVDFSQPGGNQSAVGAGARVSPEAADGPGQAPNSRVTACACSADMDIVDKTAAAPKSANLFIVGLRSQRYSRTLLPDWPILKPWHTFERAKSRDVEESIDPQATVSVLPREIWRIKSECNIVSAAG
jgi:hypothetical protein